MTTAGDDSEDWPTAQFSYLGKDADAVVLEPFGFHANLPDDTVALLLSMQGRGEGRVAMGSSPFQRPHPIEAGEVVVYHPSSGSKIHFMEDGSIEMQADVVTVTAQPEIGIKLVVGDARLQVSHTVVPGVGIDGGLLVTASVLVVENMTLGGNVLIGGNLKILGDLEVVGDSKFDGDMESQSKNVGFNHTHELTQPGVGHSGEPDPP